MGSTKYHTMKIYEYGRVEIQLYSFLILALDGGDCSASCPDHLLLG